MNIYFVQVVADPSVQFAVKDILFASQAGGAGVSEAAAESVESVVGAIGNHVPTPEGFHGIEGDIQMMLTERAIAEGFERIILGYAYDGRFLCMERVRGDYRDFRGDTAFCEAVFEITAFLHRHGINHNDWLGTTERHINNLFIVEGMRGPAIGDFGNSEEFSSVLSRLDDVERVIVHCRPGSLQRFQQERVDAGLPNITYVAKQISKLEIDLRIASRFEREKVPDIEATLEQLNRVYRRLLNNDFTPEELGRGQPLYERVMHNLSEY